MRYLVFSDVHANLEALAAVLAHCDEYDGVLCLGDLIDYGPNPNECVEIVRRLPNLTCLLGNHDLAALGAVDLDAFNPQAQVAARWTGSRLNAESRAFLQGLQPSVAAAGARLSHASPRDPVWEYLETDLQAALNFDAFTEATCLVGHTHVPRVFVESDGGRPHALPAGTGMQLRLNDARRRIINPGAVGQPRDGDPRAAYAAWDTASGVFVFKRVPYEVSETQRKIIAEGLPVSLAHRLAAGV